MNPMKILIVGPAYPLRGGIAHFNDSFAQSLIAHGQDCEVVSFYLQYPSLFFPGKSQQSKGDAPDNLTVHQWLSSIDPSSWKKAARKMVGMEPDVVVFRYWLPFMAPCLGTVAKVLRKANIPTIGLVDNAVPHERRPFDKPLSRFFLNQCTAFVTLSESVATDIGKMAPGRPVMTSPHPIYEFFGPGISTAEAREKLNLNSENRYILFFGFVRAYKGLDLLIRAIATQKVKDLDVHLIVAGEFYEEEEKYRKLIAKLELSDKVIIRSDYIPESEVRNYFCAANLVAQTYRTATQSGVTQIAYHFNRPMLVTDVGGLSEIVPDGQVGYVTDVNPDAIADAIARFFTENKEEAFSKNVEVEKSRFSWDHFTGEFLKFVRTIVNPKNEI